MVDLDALIEPVVTGLGCELWGIEQVTHGSQSRLRIFIDAESGVSVEDCERISRQLSSVLDVHDPLKGRYTLEVSSPGMDRRLFKFEQYPAYVGERIRVMLKVPFEGRRQFRGILAGVEGDEVVVRIDDEEMLIPFETIDRANLVPEFEKKPVKPVH